MADLGERAPLAEHPLAYAVRGRQPRLQDLERHLAFELRIPGPVDGALSAGAELLAQFVSAPVLRSEVGGGTGGGQRLPGGLAGAGRVCFAADAVVHGPDLRDEAKAAQDALVVVGRELGFGLIPVDGRAVGDSGRYPEHEVALIRHW